MLCFWMTILWPSFATYKRDDSTELMSLDILSGCLQRLRSLETVFISTIMFRVIVIRTSLNDNRAVMQNHLVYLIKGAWRVDSCQAAFINLINNRTCYRTRMHNMLAFLLLPDALTSAIHISLALITVLRIEVRIT